MEAEPTNGGDGGGNVADNAPSMSTSEQTTDAAAAGDAPPVMSKSEMKKRAKAERIAKEKAEKERLRLEKQQQMAKEKAANGIQELEIDDQSLTPAVRMRTVILACAPGSLESSTARAARVLHVFATSYCLHTDKPVL